MYRSTSKIFSFNSLLGTYNCSSLHFGIITYRNGSLKKYKYDRFKFCGEKTYGGRVGLRFIRSSFHSKNRRIQSNAFHPFLMYR